MPCSAVNMRLQAAVGRLSFAQRRSTLGKRQKIPLVLSINPGSPWGSICISDYD